MLEVDQKRVFFSLEWVVVQTNNVLWPDKEDLSRKHELFCPGKEKWT